MRTVVAAAVLVVLVTAAWCVPTASQNPSYMLWQVFSEDEKQAYMLGALHMLKAAVDIGTLRLWLTDGLKPGTVDPDELIAEVEDRYATSAESREAIPMSVMLSILLLDADEEEVREMMRLYGRK